MAAGLGMSRVGEVWDTGRRVFVVLEEDETNALPGESICVILILYDAFGRGVGMTTGQWVPRDEVEGDMSGPTGWKRIASFQS